MEDITTCLTRKKLVKGLLLGFFLLVFSANVWATERIKKYKVFDGTTISAGSSVISSVEIPFLGTKSEGYVTVYITDLTATGSPAVTLDVLISPDQENFFSVAGIPSIVTNFGKTSGTDGGDQDGFAVDLNGVIPAAIKIKATETTGTADVDSLTVIVIKQ